MECVIQPVRQRIVNSFLVRHEGAILVDAGMRGNTGPVLQAAGAMGLAPHDIRLIVLTHGHWDHVNSAAEIAARTGAPIALHQADASRLEQGGEVPVVPVTAWGRLVAWTLSRGIVRRVMGAALQPVPVAIRLGDADLSLAEYGIPGRIVHTPGHTRGSVSIVLDDGRALVGCMAMNGLPSVSGRPVLPIFAEDTEGLAASWRKLFGLGVRTVYPAHGGPFPAEAMRRAATAK